MTTALLIVGGALVFLLLAAASWSRVRGQERRVERRRAQGGTAQRAAARRHFQGFDEQGSVPRHERHRRPGEGLTGP